jgi:hypothetical protein
MQVRDREREKPTTAPVNDEALMLGVQLGFAIRSSEANLCEHTGKRCEPMRTEEIRSGLEYRFGVL